MGWERQKERLYRPVWALCRLAEGREGDQLLSTSGERLQQLSAEHCGFFLDWVLAEDLK